MTRRRLTVLSGGGESGRSGTVATARVLCGDCRFSAPMYFRAPGTVYGYEPAVCCRVNGDERCSTHNPEGLCPKFETRPSTRNNDWFWRLVGVAIVAAFAIYVSCGGTR